MEIKCIGTIKANTAQLFFIEDLRNTFGITVVDYGHHSCGSIGVFCKDKFSEYVVVVYENGKTIQ